jgi:excisionase family DNA binding protein
MKKEPLEYDKLLRPGQVAEMLNLDAKTVTRWAKAGRINAVRLPSGHRRYRQAEVEAIARGERGNR